jgi:hypothetical protein
MGVADVQTAYDHTRAIYQARINAARRRREALEEERFLIEAEQRALDRRRAKLEADVAEMVLAAEDNEGMLHAKEREWRGLE